MIDLIGPPAPGVTYLHVADRGADNLEVYCHCLQQSSGWAIRAQHLRRIIKITDGTTMHLNDWLAAQSVLGTYKLNV